MSNHQAGTLYIVATPIGNLGDMSPRAVETLAQVDFILAEDTRHSGRLLNHFGIQKPMVSLHEHNEQTRSSHLLQRLSSGESAALISDAGTPLISDPGYRLVRMARESGLALITVPGPCAAVAALAVSGLPSDRFFFVGFLPPKATGQRQILEQYRDVSATLIFYVSIHRALQTIETIGEVLGFGRIGCLCREMTKTYESHYFGTLQEILAGLKSPETQLKGELVLVVAGAEMPEDHGKVLNTDDILMKLLEKLSVKDAVEVVTQLTGERRNALYKRAQTLKQTN